MINIKNYTIKQFNISELKGISSKNIEEHLKLYAGYVKSTNLILNKINKYQNDLENNKYLISELRRRYSFEFAGVRNHELYFSVLEGEAKKIDESSSLFSAIVKKWGDFETWLAEFKTIGMTRGIGWTILYYDKQGDELINHWVDEHQIGHLVGLSPILCLDMWEHAFIYDYPTSEKKKYVEIFMENLNWKVVENNFEKIV